MVCRISPYIVVISLLLAGPIYVAQGMNHFMYGSDATGAGPGTKMYEASQAIDEKFGRSNLLVAIFPNDSPAKEKELVDKLEDYDYVKKVMGLSSYLPDGVPENILPESITELFHKEGYSRLLIYIKTKPESKTAYKDSEEVSALIKQYYPTDTYITGNTPTTEDMEEILIPDYTLVNNLAMISIYIVVALSFHSFVMPVIALIPIMMAIYVNMSFPYFQGKTLIFIAYAVVSCIQLGSTIDYAILCTENYIQIRQVEKDKKQAAISMLENSFPSILTSGTILIVCGYAISQLSSIPAISEVGHLVGRGAIFSVCFVTTMMPCLLKLIDKFIMSPRGYKRKKARALVQKAAIDAKNRRRQRHEKVRELLHQIQSGVPEKAPAAVINNTEEPTIIPDGKDLQGEDDSHEQK